MAKFSQMMKKADLKEHLVEGAVGFGASYAIGQAYTRFGDKWYGKKAPYIAAVGGKLGAMLMGVMGVGGQMLQGVVSEVGQAGVNAIGLEMGLRHGRAAKGQKAVLIPASAALPAGATAVGALGRAGAGRGMSWEQVEELASGV